MQKALARCTYRIQFQPAFGFECGAGLTTYLSKLGISHLYSSPVMAARRGSTHGYDVADPSRVNEQLGGEEGLNVLSSELRRHGLRLMLDIVPNHMAASIENPWWRDVLSKGGRSAWAEWFDIDWYGPASHVSGGRVVMPLLDSSLAHAVNNGAFHLAVSEFGCVVRYYDHELPLSANSLRRLLFAAAGEFSHEEATWLHAVASGNPDAMTHVLSDAYQKRNSFKAWFDERLGVLSRDKRWMLRLLSTQHYALKNWRAAGGEINYRRFFAINELVGLRVEREDTFLAAHERLAGWLSDVAEVDAVRVDHIDGLYDPLQYLQRLQALFHPPNPHPSRTLVEKILAAEEILPLDWPTSGSTGYEFICWLDHVQLPKGGLEAVTSVYEHFIGRRAKFADIVYGKKRQVIRSLFSGEFRALGRRFATLAAASGRKEFDAPLCTRLLEQAAACYRVYRTYGRSGMGRKEESTGAPPEMSGSDRIQIESALKEAARRDTTLHPDGLRWLGQALSCDSSANIPTRLYSEWGSLVQRWQQFTGPIMAIGYENSALFVYQPLASLNEVGGDPELGGITADEFHRRMRIRLQLSPGSFNATSTHDTKRSEDVRARLNALAEMPKLWRACLRRWSAWNRHQRRGTQRRPIPDLNTEYHLYQTLLGAWPITGLDEEFRVRIREYMLKAAREAKVATRWTRPNADFERGLTEFVDAVLDPARPSEFIEDLGQIAAKLSPAGALNSLVQVLLKMCAPGVPDIYQGCELWNLALVDPDNRRAVNFDARRAMLGQIETAGIRLPELTANWRDGQIKMWLIRRLLQLRSRYPEAFETGDYVSVAAEGAQAKRLLAFCRHDSTKWVMSIAPLHVAEVTYGSTPSVAALDWGATRLCLPEGAPRSWRSEIDGNIFAAHDGSLEIEPILKPFPVGVLTA